MKSKPRGEGCKESRSPPSRGAWIEIGRCPKRAPRGRRSPPSRGAWIEILLCINFNRIAVVGRPPRGGRGLKWSA